MDKIISVAEDYSRFPAGRYPEDGPFNGTRFREQILVPALRTAVKEGHRVVVILDGVAAYSSSFLEEVFGGVAREPDLPKRAIKSALEIRANDIAYRSAQIDAERYLQDSLDAR